MEIIPVIHIIDEHQVVENIRTILNCGINKVFFIDHNGGYKRPIMFAKDCKYNVKKWCGTDLWVGVNMLGCDAKKLLCGEEIRNISYDLSGIDGLWSDDGLSHLTETELLDIKANITYKGQFFGGLAFKYQSQPIDSLTACEHSKIITDVSTTSGVATGKAPTVVKIEGLRHYLDKHPMAIASGVSVDNIKSFIGLAQYVLVASSITDHNELIVKEKLNNLIEASKK